MWPLNAVPNSSWVLEDFVIIAAFSHFVSEKVNLGKVAGLNVLLKAITKFSRVSSLVHVLYTVTVFGDFIF